jgi:hypothetical protein
MKRLILFLLPIIAFAQIQYSGSISPTYLKRISDGSEISLPFRLADLQLSYSVGNFELKTNTALETRWKGSEAELDIRELYLVWYPSFGEIKLGKIIHTWGAADGNNPTDNINPYDFYYMFLAGVDQKIGVFSGSLKAYWNNLNLEGIFIPEHTANRLPFGEEDFPIQFPEIDRFAKIIDEEYEFGIRLQSGFNWGDASISYFNGHDNSFSWLRMTDLSHGAGVFAQAFGYRKTEMFGADFVTFIGDLTIRTEAGYFKTNNDEYLTYELGINDFDPPYSQSYVNNYYNAQSNQKLAKMASLYETPEIIADYLQYVIQLEYSGFSDIMLATQIIGTYVNDVSSEYLKFTESDKTDFTPGMGTPFAIIAEKALIVNGTANLMDDRLEIEAMSLINLEETGYLLGINFGYSPIENWELKLGVSKFIGDADDPENRFTQMEDFSHISLSLEFNF